MERSKYPDQTAQNIYDKYLLLFISCYINILYIFYIKLNIWNIIKI